MGGGASRGAEKPWKTPTRKTGRKENGGIKSELYGTAFPRVSQWPRIRLAHLHRCTSASAAACGTRNIGGIAIYARPSAAVTFNKM